MYKILYDIDNIEKTNKRIDKILSELPEVLEKNISRSLLQKLILEGNLKKNDIVFCIPSYKTKIGDKFILSIPNAKKSEIEAKNIPLNIVYEDNDLLVINKQSGLTTHPGAGNFDNTLVNALLNYCKDSLSGIGGIARPGIVHRLDKDTSGLMVVAKNDKAHHSLSEQIQTRTLSRVYYAFIWGIPSPKSGIIEGYIDRNKIHRLKMELTENSGRYSKTNYSTIEEFGNFASLIECKLDTGRTHQIRVHFSANKYPLIGDILYGGHSKKVPNNCMDESSKEYIDTFPRQALHSKRISFFQPTTGKKLEFDSDLPDDMKKLFYNLRKSNINL